MGLERAWVLVSAGVLEPVPLGHWGMAVEVRVQGTSGRRAQQVSQRMDGVDA